MRWVGESRSPVTHGCVLPYPLALPSRRCMGSRGRGAWWGEGRKERAVRWRFFHECIFPCYLRRSGRPTQAVILPSSGKQDEALTLLWRRKNLLSPCRHCTRMSEFPHWSWPVCEGDHGATYPTIVRSHICRACVGERETSSTQGQTSQSRPPFLFPPLPLLLFLPLLPYLCTSASALFLPSSPLLHASSPA